ncbi:aldose epimerase family protein [Nocardioides bruguierae]|uniref:Aldose 1-epimerase n=1 Tax=Nocardioides bruguierae TaxID=2945102 RepID=A0A9X2D893_9ACTN|nr:aldose epimerase family protein [Nocardioides bruguierae]MCM0621123.1 galactose mutarotase [Nocardioides bruguierae]
MPDPRGRLLGTLDDGRPVRAHVIGAAPGPLVEVLDLGAAVRRLEVTGGDGVRRDVTLGYAGAQEYADGGYFLGAVVGRYANRIADGTFTLDGRAVRVGTSDRGHHLHGGPAGFDTRTWDVLSHGPDHVELGLVSEDGDQGFPGRLAVTARYEVAGETVRLVLGAEADAPTLVNLTSHLYLDLDGHGVDDLLLEVPADGYLPVDATGIPLGPVEPVESTPFDLREPTRLGDVARSGHPQVAAAQGLDHNLVVRGTGQRTVATLTSARTGTRVTIGSDRPGLQVYTGNFLDGRHPRRDGTLLRQGDGIALEPQLFPDTPHHPHFGSAVLRPGETYRHEITWTFGA